MDVVLAVGVVSALMAIGWAGLRLMERPRAVRSAAEIVEEIEHPSTRPAQPDKRREAEAVVAPSVDVVTVYQCEQNGQKVMSDRPCGPGAVTLTVDASRLSTYQPVPAAPVDMDRYRTLVEVPPSAGSAGAGPKANASKCAAIQDWIDRINAAMRQGYTSQQGEWLRAEWRRAKEAYYDGQCGRLEVSH